MTYIAVACLFLGPILLNILWIAFLVVAVRKQAGGREIARGLVYAQLSAFVGILGAWMGAWITVTYIVPGDFVFEILGGAVGMTIVAIAMFYPLVRYARRKQPTRWEASTETFREQCSDLGDNGVSS